MNRDSFLPRQRPSRLYKRKSYGASEPKIDEQHVDFLLAQLDDLIIKRDYNEAALVFCALALHQRSIPEAIWRGGIEIVRGHSDAVFNQGIMFYRQMQGLNRRQRDIALLELGLYLISLRQNSDYDEAISAFKGLLTERSAATYLSMVHGYIGFTQFSQWVKAMGQPIEHVASGGIDELRRKVMRDRNSAFGGRMGELWDESRASFQAATELDPHCDCYAYYQALMHSIASELDAARATLSNFSQLNPTNLNAMRMQYRLLKGYFSKEKAAQAEVLLQLLRRDASLDKEFIDLGLLYHLGHVVSGDMAEISVLRLEICPNDAALWRILCHALAGMFKAAGAVGPIIKSIDVPWRFKLHWVKGNFMSTGCLEAFRPNDRELLLFRALSSLLLFGASPYFAAATKLLASTRLLDKLRHCLDVLSLNESLGPAIEQVLTDAEVAGISELSDDDDEDEDEDDSDDSSSSDSSNEDGDADTDGNMKSDEESDDIEDPPMNKRKRSRQSDSDDDNDRAKGAALDNYKTRKAKKISVESSDDDDDDYDDEDE